MTEFPAPDPAGRVDGSTSSVEERLAQLRNRQRPAPGGPSRAAPRRHHPAQGSRIAAAGIGMATMFGLVGAMAWHQQSATAGTPTPLTPAPAPATTTAPLPQTFPSYTPSTAPAGASTPSAPSPTSPTSAPAAPIPLTPKVTVAPAPPRTTQAPVARTHGSH